MSAAPADRPAQADSDLHAEYIEHTRWCPQYRYGRRCRTADELLARADVESGRRYAERYGWVER